MAGVDIAGLEGNLYSQGGTAKDNAEAGATAWLDLLAFLTEAQARHNRD